MIKKKRKIFLGDNILIDTRGGEHEFDHFLEVSDAMDWISFSVHACRLDFLFNFMNLTFNTLGYVNQQHYNWMPEGTCRVSKLCNISKYVQIYSRPCSNWKYRYSLQKSQFLLDKVPWSAFLCISFFKSCGLLKF